MQGVLQGLLVISKGFCSLVFYCFKAGLHQCEMSVKPLGTSVSPQCLDGLTYTELLPVHHTNLKLKEHHSFFDHHILQWLWNDEYAYSIPHPYTTLVP